MILAWRPFLDPLNIHDLWWALLIPLALGTAIAYKAVRHPTMNGYWRSVAVMTIQTLATMGLLGVAAFLFVEYIFPAIAPMRP